MNEVSKNHERDDSSLSDENAFGLWVSWHDAEEVEYSQSADKFAPRLIVFWSAISEFLASFPLGRNVVALDLGTAVYLELADGDHDEDLVAWTRSFRAYLAQGDWRTFAVITYGGRWVRTDESARVTAPTVGITVLSGFGPSEPLRRAMAAEALSRDDEDEGFTGWGDGLFVDLDALEAMERVLKNEPTKYRAGGTWFCRLGS